MFCYFLQLDSEFCVCFQCVIVLPGLPMAAGDPCTKELRLGQGLNNPLSFGGRIHERISMLHSHFPLSLVGYGSGSERDLGSGSRILLSKPHCYYFLLWETLVDMQLQ